MDKINENSVYKTIEVGSALKGTVKNFQPYGAFVELENGRIGLIHIEDISIARIKSPAERLELGQEITTFVKSINKTNGKINLSYKEMYGSWDENAAKFQAGTKVKGIIKETEKNKNGIFIELTPNLVGMAEYKDGYEYGNEVEVYIKKIDSEKKKIKLIIT